MRGVGKKGRENMYGCLEMDISFAEPLRRKDAVETPGLGGTRFSHWRFVFLKLFDHFSFQEERGHNESDGAVSKAFAELFVLGYRVSSDVSTLRKDDITEPQLNRMTCPQK
jgi:hypothetical protein